MKIHQFNESEISNIEIETVFDTLDDLSKDDNKSMVVTFLINTENFANDFAKNEALVEEFDGSDQLLEFALREKFPQISYGVGVFDIEFESEIENRGKIHALASEFIAKLNGGIQTVITEKLGDDLELFIKRKESEAHDDMFRDYENLIRRLVYKELRMEVGEKDANLILSSTAVPRDFDMKQHKIEFNETASTSLKIQRTNNATSEYRLNKPLYDKIESSKYVDKIKFLQKNNNDFVSIVASKEALELVEKICDRCTKEFYSNPRYKEPNNDKLFDFAGRVNDGKGNDADVLVNKTTNEMVLIIKDNQYDSPTYIGELNPILKSKAKDVFIEFLSNKQKQKQNKKRKKQLK
jgi:cytochrome b involved in lipid metabolism